MTPQELVSNGFRDLVSPFMKDEPHPPRKADVGAWRIVQCVSLVDQLVERVLYTRPVTSLKKLYPTSDAVVGIGFTDEQTAVFHQEARSQLGETLKATDIAGWDRSLGEGWVHEAAESIIRSSTSDTPAWSNAVRNHVYGLTHPAFIIPNGKNHLVVQRSIPGGMLSGSYMTTTFNTLARLDVAQAAGSLRAKAAGDDCLEVFPKGYDYVQAYAAIGFTIRESTTVDPTVFEFCSHEYRDSHPREVPLVSWLKTVHRYFLLRNVTIEQYCAILHELRHNKELDELRPLLQARFEECLEQPTPGAGVEQKLQDKQN